MLLRTIKTFAPSSELAHVDLGAVFTVERTGKSYLLVARDPWTAKVVRFTWWDRFLFNATEWLQDKFRRKTN